ncbi:MAG: nucleotidyl transferase AbiEii/AbiGii toxin family protein [Brevinematia bacterium]
MKKILKDFQLKALELIVKSGITEDFYLAGGTAILLRYNHRFSEDFDFFLFPDKETDFFNLLSSLKNTKTELVESKKDTLIFFFEKVRFSFFVYKYPLLKKTTPYEELKINIASDEDITAMKSIAVIQRGKKKDFFDLFFLMKINKLNLKDVIHLCEKKYKNNFNRAIFLKALIYFKDAEDEKIKEIDREWESIKNFFSTLVKNFLS